MCQPWNLDIHPEYFPRTIYLIVEDERFRWSDEPATGTITLEGKWISDQEFQADDGRVFECAPPDGDGRREGEVRLKT